MKTFEKALQILAGLNDLIRLGRQVFAVPL
jgi:hypothetical protein